MSPKQRQSTGVAEFDELLGGGLVPGTLTVILGATGIGKTHLGLQFAHAGRQQEGRCGLLCDVSARGDSQGHAEYARRMFGWDFAAGPWPDQMDWDNFFHPEQNCGDYLHLFDYHGRRVTRQDLEFHQWQQWQGQLNARLRTAIGFLYGNFVRGARRVVIDGIEPADRPGDSIQFHLIEYLYHQVLRKDPQWVARDLFRERYRQHAERAAQHAYDSSQIGCVLLCTAHETMLDDLIARPLHEGDLLSNANTLIYMGKLRQAQRLERGLYIAKHRRSECTDQIVPFRIDERGLRMRADG